MAVADDLPMSLGIDTVSALLYPFGDRLAGIDPGKTTFPAGRELTKTVPGCLDRQRTSAFARNGGEHTY
jgi:hypothetical protein